MTVCRKISNCSRVKKLFHVWKADPHSQLEKHNLQFDPILVHLHSYFGWHTIKLLCSWVGLPHKNFFESHIQILLHLNYYLSFDVCACFGPSVRPSVCPSVCLKKNFLMVAHIKKCKYNKLSLF